MNFCAIQPASEGLSMADWLNRIGSGSDDEIAVIGPDATLSYRALVRAVTALAQRLTDAGIGPGDRVGIAATRSASTIVAILATVQAGAGYVPLDTGYPAERLQAMLEDARPRVVLGDPIALEALRALAPAFPTLDHPAPRVGSASGAPADLTYVLFTSGSTGRPKGVAMGAAPLHHLIDWHAAHPRLGRPARTLQFAPLSFDVHCQEIFSTIACRGTLVVLPEAIRRDPVALHAALIEHRIERLFLPFVALQLIAEASTDAVPASLREVISAGEQLQVTPAIRSLFARVPGLELHNHYGPTETHVVTAHELTGDPAAWPAIPPIGLPLPHVRVALRASDGSPDDTGELMLGGDTLAHGYLGRPDLTAERFIDDLPGEPGRWYATGDLVRRDAEGVLTYLGRADQQLKVDGFRIEPGEIELALMAHPAVKEAVVTAPDVPGVGKQLVAYLVLREGAGADAALIPQMRAQLRASLPEYMVPVRYLTLERLPTTPSGKIDRRGLPLPQVETRQVGGDPVDAARGLWQELLGVDRIHDTDNLFDLGARSLLVLRFIARFKELTGRAVAVADLYDRPTLGALGSLLRGDIRAARRVRPAASSSQRIAIVGMATRTPGAGDVDTFWTHLLEGREGIRHFSPDQIDPSVPESIRSRPNFVAARGVLEDADRFDAGFFGIGAREATLIDPQQRLLLELCWNALEHAAIDPTRTPDRIGVYAGTGNNTYAPALRQEQPELIQQAGEFAAMLASEKDYAATRVSHRLNLNGPAVSIHTACSTGLVAVAQAWHALASGQCDVALAGGASIVVPQQGGYLHVEGAMESADGHCRPFDAEASGTVFASGGGIVVLKRLEDALASGDTVYGVLRGVGLNNDGGDKASFTAPSVSGQAAAIRMALDHAQVDARQIGYVEAHGTGTALGDPIEVAALTRAWREDTPDREFCGLGSLKSNLGHMVAAAGVVGLVKATLALHREVIPGTIHFRQPNPQIDFANSPFRVVARNTPWPRGPQPRLAAVSSFGVGGTNAHVVIEEAPAAAAHHGAADARRWVLPLSARTPADLARRAQDLAAHLDVHPALPLDEVAATLMRGRKPMAQRLAVVAADAAEAAAALRRPRTAVAALAQPRVVFLFPGQGSQHPGMARGLYDEAPAFREALDRCLGLLDGTLGAELRAWLVDAEPGDAAVAERLAETRHAQPALFSMSYAIAAWLDSLGVRPAAMIGHSIGEYAAACRAGVMSLEDAMRCVVERGRAMYDQPAGAMLAVRTDAQAVAARLPAGVEIAGVNAPALTVVAGDFDAIDAVSVSFESADIGTTRLKVSHAFHSARMDGALPRVATALAQATLHVPAATVYSCVSGEPLTAAQATDPGYWARQVRAPVQFSRAVQAELALGESVFVEVGPGQALTALLRQHRQAAGTAPVVVPMLGAAQAPGDPAQVALGAIGALWCAGVDIAWPIEAQARRATLPTYPFAGERHWFARRAGPAQASPLPSAAPAGAALLPKAPVAMNRLPRIEQELKRLLSDVSGIGIDEIDRDATFVDQGMDSLSMTQATLEIERVFGTKLRFRRLQEDLNSVAALGAFLDADLPADRYAPAPAAVTSAETPVTPLSVGPAAAMAPVAGNAVQQLIQQQLAVMAQQLAALTGQAAALVAAPMLPAAAVAAPPAAPREPGEPAQPSAKSLVEKPFGASARITLERSTDFTPAQRRWIDTFIADYNRRTGQSKSFSQQHRKLMADPRVVTGFNPLWKDLVYPIVVNRSKGARLWDLDGNEYIDLLSCFGANLLGYQPEHLVDAMVQQLHAGIEVGPQHPLSAEVAGLIAEFTGMERVAFCNTGSEAVMGAMRMARTVTGRKTIAIFTNSYHGIFDEVIVRGTKQLRSLSAAPGILAAAVENVLVLDYASDESLRILRERGPELAAIMIEPIQNKYPTLQPREFVKSLRAIADEASCALIFDEVVTGFRIAPGGAQEFYGVRADISTFGKVIGGGLPFAAIAGGAHWMDALDGGDWRYGDDSFPEAGVTYFAGTFVRHPLALAAAKASLLYLKQAGREFYRSLNERTQRLIDRLNTAFVARGAPVRAVHCASLWRLSWDDDQKQVSLFYYLVRHHGLHLYEQFGHFVTEAMGEAELDRIFEVFTGAVDELMAQGFITPRAGATPPPPPPQRVDPVEGPLAPGQTERWLAAIYDPAARRALNESFCVALSGPVDVGALKLALNDVLRRHEAFRLSFDLDEARQKLAPTLAMTVAEVDLRDRADARAALDAFCVEAARRDFPLERAPLAAASLVLLSDGRVVVHLVASHLVFDGWASSVFNAELATAYRARSAGMAPTFAPAESPIAFAAQEQARMSSAQGRESLDHWQALLKNPPPLLALGDRVPGRPRAYSADTVRTVIDGDTLAGLKALARSSGATLFQVLLASVTAMLARVGGQPEFVVSIPYAAQGLGRHGPLIADGVLDLPLRLSTTAEDSAHSLLGRVRSQLMDALEHPLATQGTIARALGITSAGDRPPLSSVYFNLNPRVDLSGFAPLGATMQEARKQGTLSDLFFNFYEQGDRLTLDLHHSADYYSPQRATELVDALLDTCRAFVGAPEAPLAAAAAPAVDARLLSWNATARPVNGHARIEQWVSRQAAATPDAVALEARGTVLSYRQLESRANRYANLMRARGIGAGMRVGLCLSRGPDLLPALLGVLKTGAAYVPLDPGFPQERLHYMAADADVKLVITESSNAARSGVSRGLQLRVDDDAVLIASASDAAVPADPSWTGEATAYVIYTSGSTGKPKGVVLPQRAVCNFLASMRREPGLQAHNALLAVTTLSFDIAVLELLLPLVCGARVVLAQREDTMDGEVLAGLIAEHRIDVMQATPTTWHLLLDSGWRAPQGFRALCGGEPLPAALAARLLDQGLELWNMYGPTETTVWSTVSRIASREQKIDIGLPIDNTQVWILDDKLAPCAVGQEGEICIGGLGVALGYHERPELTADRFVADPFAGRRGALLYRTGDLGRWREDGRLEHLGRLDFQVKIRGYRIELGEIEARLEAQPEVARCVVVAREDSPGDTALAAYVVGAPGSLPQPAALRTALRRDLPDYMIPRHVVVLEALPLLPNGKIDRKSLPAPEAGAAPAAAPAAATAATVHRPEAGDLATKIAALMAELLGQPTMALDANFFELGGHSLLAARLSAQLAGLVGQRPGLRVIFESPTPAALAVALAPAAAAPAESTASGSIPIRADQSTAPLSQMQQRVWFLENLNPGTVVHGIPTGHRLTGPLDVEAFDRAFRMLIQRQSVLRTVVERTPEGGRQRILPTLDFSLLPLDDLSALPEPERKATMAATIARLVETPYDLETGPLFTARLFRLSPEEHGFLFQSHHLIWDAWSFDILYTDLSELYDACLNHREPKLPPITVSYGDFAAWHNEWMTGDELKRQTGYWVKELTPLPPPVELPLDRPRPPEMSGKGGSFQFNLSKDITQALRQQAQAKGRTLYVTLLAAYTLMLSRLCRQDDFVVGTPVRGREQLPLEPLMGFFVNMLPMRMTLDESTPLDRWLGALHRKVVDSFSYPDVPFDHLVRELKVPRDSSRPPVHQVSFSYQDVRDRPSRWGNVEHARMPTPMLGAAQDLALWCVETRNHIEFVFTFNADVLDTSSVARIGERLEGLLKQFITDPDAPLSRYTLVTAAEREAMPAPSPTSPTGGHNPTRLMLIHIWKDLLQIPDVGVDQTFIELGGHSLLVMRMAARIEAALGLRVPLNVIFKHETVATLADWIDLRTSAPAPLPATGSSEVVPTARPEPTSAPLTLMQQRVWFVEAMQPGTPTYNIPAAIRLEGSLDVAALGQAINALVERHPALRTTITNEIDQEPRQHVAEHVQLTLGPVEDLSPLDDNARAARLLDRIAELSRRPFDLLGQPLHRWHLFRLSAHEHVLFFAMHHLISDGWSMQLAKRDLSALYLAAKRGTAVDLPVLPLGYAQFAVEHSALVESGALAGQIEHWQKLLTPLPEALAMPADFTRPSRPSNLADSVLVEVPQVDVDALLQLGRRTQATLFMVTMAAYVAFLHRHTGQSDFVVGMPTRGRSDARLEDVFGFFSNILPMRIRLEPEWTFVDLVRHVQSAVRDSFEHPDVPLEQVIRNLKVPRDESRSPLFQTLFGYQEAASVDASFGDLKRGPFSVPVEGIAEDLTVWMWNGPAGLKAYLAYATDLFSRATAEQFAQRLVGVIRSVTRSPELRLDGLDVRLPQEQALIASWNATHRPFDRSTTLNAVLAATAQRRPEDIAVIEPGVDSVSHGELQARANRLAHALRARGIGRGALVGLCVERGIGMVVAQLAILKSGAAYVPLDPSYPAGRLAAMAEDAGLALLVTESTLVHALDWPRKQSLLLDIDAAQLASQPGSAPPVDTARDARAEDPAYVIYTSGSTGKPKGVMVPHRAVVNFLRSMAREPGLGDADTLVAVTTLSFDIAVLELLLPLSVGARIVLANRDQRLDGAALRELVEEHGATVMQATPSTWRALIDAGWSGSPGFKALIGGESLPTGLAVELLERVGELWNMYGPTETTVWSTCWKVNRPEAGVFIGRPIDNTTVQVLDPAGHPCPIGVPGEICIGGDGVALGYLNRPELTAERFVPDPWSTSRGALYRTGDLGRWRLDGLLEHQGRMDTQVKVRGYRIELGEIETALANHPNVARCLVSVREDQPGDVRLVAYVVPNGDMPSASDLREHLRARLPDYMVPQHTVHLDAIPLLPNGKIDRNALPAPDAGLAIASSRKALVEPTSDAEKQIAAIWSELLSLDQISTTDNFFDLGGHSLLAMNAVKQIEKRVGLRISVRRMIFETLGQIAGTAAEPAAAPPATGKGKGWFDRLTGALRS